MRSHKPWIFTSFIPCQVLLIFEVTRNACAHMKKRNTCHNTRKQQFASSYRYSFHLSGTHTLPRKSKSVLNFNSQTAFALLKQFVFRSSQLLENRKQQLAQPLGATLTD